VLKGRDYFDQLKQIITLIGKPSEDDMKHLQYETARKALRRLKDEGNGIKKRFGRIRIGGIKGTTTEATNPLALDLLENMLRFNPSRRYTVEQCLAHKYLEELHQDADEPVCPKAFDYSFEDGYKEEMPKALLQKHMMNTLRDVNRKAGK